MRNIVLIIIVLFFSQYSYSVTDYLENDSVPYSARLLSRYIKHESVTGNERIAGIFFSTIARQKGFHVNVLTDEPGSYNFTASLYPLESGKPNIILLNHIDVVPAGKSGEYTHPPFSGAIADGYIWGRGALDMKGMAVMQLLAMTHFLDQAIENDLPFNITMLAVSGEEKGGDTGARIISERFMELLNPVAVCGEGGVGLPGVLRDEDRKLFGISVADKRTLWLEVTLEMNMPGGHGAITPFNYVVLDKIRALNRLANRSRRVRFTETTRNMFYELGRVEGGIRGLALRNPGFFRPFVNRAIRREEIIYSLVTNTVTITGINTPYGPPNLIPQEITTLLDCRLLPEVDTEEFISEVRDILGNEVMRIRILNEDIHTYPTRPDIYYDMMVEALEVVYPGSAAIPILAPASNDNGYFRYHGIPTYGLLPVFVPVNILETIHNVDERIPVDAMEQGISVYSELIRRIINQDTADIIP
jgi:carboxypeptidase PM20D1